MLQAECRVAYASVCIFKSVSICYILMYSWTTSRKTNKNQKALVASEDSRKIRQGERLYPLCFRNQLLCVCYLLLLVCYSCLFVAK